MADTAPRDPATEAAGTASSPASRLVHALKLASGAIVGLAALLGAIALILDLVEKDPVPEVGADFGALVLTATTLDDFQASQKFASAGLPRVPVRLASAAATLAQEPPQDDDGGETTDPEQQQESQPCPSPQEVDAGAAVPAGCPTGGQPCPTATEVAELGIEVPAGCPDAGLDCPEAGEIDAGAAVPAGCPPAGAEEKQLPDDAQKTVEQLNVVYDMGRGCSGDPTGSGCALTALERSAGGEEGGSRAKRLGRVREVLAGTRTQLGLDGKRRPMGMMVSIDVTLTGMSGERLEVYWSMLSADTSRALGQSWLRNTRATTLRPSAQRDQLQKDLWLPLPRERGRYRARVTLLDDQGRRFTKRSAVFR